jgi:hypothetical protein
MRIRITQIGITQSCATAQRAPRALGRPVAGMGEELHPEAEKAVILSHGGPSSVLWSQAPKG